MKTIEPYPFDLAESRIPNRFKSPVLIAKGTFSCVYRSRDSQLDREVAIKEVMHSTSMSRDAEQKAIHEIQLLTRLNHPGIIRLLDVCRSHHSIFLIQPYCAKGAIDLEQIGQKLPFNVRLSIIDTLLNATRYLHAQGWLHCDIKPDNLLLDSRDIAFLSDFGEARPISSISTTPTMVGSVGYMAPELLMGKSEPSISSEIYSIGVTVYEILSAQRAFSSDSVLILSAAMENRVPYLTDSIPASKDWNAVIQKATSLEVSDRYGTVCELADDIQRIYENKPVSSRKVSVVEQFHRWIKREPFTASLIISILLVVLLGTIASIVAWIHASRQLGISETNQKEVERLSQLAVTAKTKLDEAIELATAESEKARIF